MSKRKGETDTVQEVLRNLEVRIEEYLYQWQLEFGTREESEEDTGRGEPRLQAFNGEGNNDERAR